MNSLPTRSPFRRRLRAAFIHIGGPLAVYLSFVSITTGIHWHGPVTDLMAMIVIMVVNTWSIWTAKWTPNLSFRWRILITVGALVVSFFFMFVISMNIRTDFG